MTTSGDDRAQGITRKGNNRVGDVTSGAACRSARRCVGTRRALMTMSCIRHFDLRCSMP